MCAEVRSREHVATCVIENEHSSITEVTRDGLTVEQSNSVSDSDRENPSIRPMYDSISVREWRILRARHGARDVIP